jgi:hypothetical protein
MEKMGATEAGEGEGVVRGQRREERRDRSSFQVTDQKGKKKEERKIEGWGGGRRLSFSQLPPVGKRALWVISLHTGLIERMAWLTIIRFREQLCQIERC